MADRNIFYPEITEKRAQAEADNGAQGGVGSISDLGWGLVDSALARPYNATAGLVLPKIDLSANYNHKSIAGQIGDFGGSVADIVVLSKVTGFAVTKGLGRAAQKGLISASVAESPVLASTLSLGSTGALYGGVFTPGSGTERLKNATVGLTTFATMGATTGAMDKYSFLGKAGSRTLFQNVGVGGLSGLPAGFVDAQVTSLVNGRGFNTDATSIGKTMGYYGLFGATMGGVAHGIEHGVPKARGWFAEKYGGKAAETPSAKTADGVRTSEAATNIEAIRDAEPATTAEKLVASTPAAAEVRQPVKFNIPETGNIELGQMMRGLSSADQIRLVQEVIASRPNVPAGSWMRLIAEEDMAQFLRAIDQMYPKTALRNSQHLIDTRNLRPPTADGTINFEAWEKALATVKAEKAAAAKAVTPKPDEVTEVQEVKPKPDEVVPELNKAAERPFVYEDVTMTVKNPEFLKDAIANNADGAFGSTVLKFANRWATIMEQKMAAGEKLTPEMIYQASRETNMDVRNYHADYARGLLAQTWEHGAQLNRTLAVHESATGLQAIAKAADELTPAQAEQFNMFGSVLQSVSRSRAEAIERVAEMDPAHIDPDVRRLLSNYLIESQGFLRSFGVDATESVQSIVNSMQNVPKEHVATYVHHADQFHHDTFAKSVMFGMDQAVALGNILPGTQQAWIDALSSKMRIVFPGIKESEWAISKLNK